MPYMHPLAWRSIKSRTPATPPEFAPHIPVLSPEEQASWSKPLRGVAYPAFKHRALTAPTEEQASWKHLVYVYTLPGALGCYVGKSDVGLERVKQHLTPNGSYYIYRFIDLCPDHVDALSLEIIPVTESSRDQFEAPSGSLGKLTKRLESELISVVPRPLNVAEVDSFRRHRPTLADFLPWSAELRAIMGS